MISMMFGYALGFFILIEDPTLAYEPGYWIWLGIWSGFISAIQLFRSQLILATIFISSTFFAQFILFTFEMILPWLLYLWIYAVVLNTLERRVSLYSLIAFSFVLVIWHSEVPFSLFFMSVASMILILSKQQQKWERSALLAENECQTVRAEYRQLKRLLQSQEEQTRAQERTRIARDIHDNVGHQLTALAMQLEMVEMGVEKGQIDYEAIKQSKHLATQSLKEMRSSVQAIRHEDIKGFASVLQLIRRLEAESHIQVNLTTRKGALLAPLTNDHMITIYRIVQEAVTNAMRHARAREVDLIFEGIAKQAFQLTISNKNEHVKVAHREGFGLSAMRERVEALQGRLATSQVDETFTIAVYFPLKPVSE
ncbi:sensor histidine kinase [Alkalihalobacillus pseudalcaliphilus]|uniref:sensor histidine kinase n=1 Tax=Alkalihalobacillus pseudalcaliphilus TaxID=79884 RepID=UPI00069F8E1C|nr:sensor histidine kinase [Alkalihalobacillus pseudalcaliphilus]